MQRKIVKCTEDIQIRYDGTVRDTIGSIIQHTYGSEGMDPRKTVTVAGEPNCCNVARIADRLNSIHKD